MIRRRLTAIPAKAVLLDLKARSFKADDARLKEKRSPIMAGEYRCYRVRRHPSEGVTRRRRRDHRRDSAVTLIAVLHGPREAPALSIPIFKRPTLTATTCQDHYSHVITAGAIAASLMNSPAAMPAQNT